MFCSILLLYYIFIIKYIDTKIANYYRIPQQILYRIFFFYPTIRRTSLLVILNI